MLARYVPLLATVLAGVAEAGIVTQQAEGMPTTIQGVFILIVVSGAGLLGWLVKMLVAELRSAREDAAKREREHAAERERERQEFLTELSAQRKTHETELSAQRKACEAEMRAIRDSTEAENARIRDHITREREQGAALADALRRHMVEERRTLLEKLDMVTTAMTKGGGP